MKIVTVIGARPQFIKAAAVSRAIRHQNESDFSQPLQEVIIHTGQHYDKNMSQIFFDQLDIPVPDYNLEIGGGLHGEMTGKMLGGIERVLIKEKPDWVLIYGDTNSTLAGAIAACKLHIPVAHVEAGLRSYNMDMPEEINRILSDRVSKLLFCPTDTAVNNLKKENIIDGVSQVGDVMYDASLFYKEIVKERSSILEKLSLNKGEFVLVTCHRAENVDDPIRLSEIVEGLAAIARKNTVVFPVHPRTNKQLSEFGLLEKLTDVLITDPLPFLDMIRLEEAAKLIITDSGGVQKEAYFFSVPCITMRDETEWLETLESGWNKLVGADAELISESVSSLSSGVEGAYYYGRGDASKKIVTKLLSKYYV